MTFAMSRTIRSVSLRQMSCKISSQLDRPLSIATTMDHRVLSIFQMFFLNGLKFYGSNYNGLYVNNNGNVTFGSALSTFTPGTIGAGSSLKIIAPFWADVDTRLIPATTERPNPPENGEVHWNLDRCTVRSRPHGQRRILFDPSDQLRP